MYKIIFSVLIFFIFSGAFANISISPLKYEITIEKGKTKTKIIKIKNSGNKAVTLYPSKENFIAGDDSGFPKLIKTEDTLNPEFNLTNWIEIENESITLGAGESKQVKFRVKVPETGEPGGHYGIIFFGPEAEKGAQVSILHRLGILLLVNIPGEVKIKGEFGDLEIGNFNGNNFISPNIFKKLPISFSVFFKNTGNIHLKPKGKIELFDENGEIFKKIGKEKIVSEAGAVIGEKVVDYIPVNESLGNVLPNSSRRFVSKWEGFGYNLVNEITGEKEIKFKNLSDFYTEGLDTKQKFISFYEKIKQKKVTKPITANYYLYFEGKDKAKNEKIVSKVFYVSYDQKYVGINMGFIGIIIIFMISGYIYFVIIKPRISLENEKKLRKKILEEIKNKN